MTSLVAAGSRNVAIQCFAHEKIPRLLIVQGAATATAEQKPVSELAGAQRNHFSRRCPIKTDR